MNAKEAMHILQNLAQNVACEELHHKKAQRHAFILPCPVVEEIQQAAGTVSKRIALLETVAEAAANTWSIKVDYTSPIHIALRAAGYLKEQEK